MAQDKAILFCLRFNQLPSIPYAPLLRKYTPPNAAKKRLTQEKICIGESSFLS